jgi:hypothetical protein
LGWFMKSMRTHRIILGMAAVALVCIYGQALAQGQMQRKTEPKLAPWVGKPEKVPPLQKPMWANIAGVYWGPPAAWFQIKEKGNRYKITQTDQVFTVFHIPDQGPKTIVALGEIFGFNKVSTSWFYGSGGHKGYRRCKGEITKMSNGWVAEEIMWSNGVRFVRQGK